MIASEARIAANRANALKSTGPRTDEGKERSRGNAVKHGLTGAGVALSPEDAALVEARLAGFQQDFRPVTEAGKDLVRRAAVLSVRLERCVIQEAAALSRRIGAARDDFDEGREAEVDALFAGLIDAPAASVRRLLRMPEGVDRMLDAWADLRADLAHEDGSRWGQAHAMMALRLTGREPGGFGIPRVEALARAFDGDFRLLEKGDGAGLDDRGRREWARRALLSLIDQMTATLRDHLAKLDLGKIDADRERAGDVALFDPSKAACLARKYEAAAEREMHRAIREMRAIEAEAAARPAAVSAPTPASALGSFSPVTVSEFVRKRPTPAPASAEAPAGSSFVPISAGRAPNGSN